jgi:hypothetical protein
MGIVIKGSVAAAVGGGSRRRVDCGLFAREAGVESCATHCGNLQGWKRAAFPVREIDRQRGVGAGIAVRRAEVEHDHGRRQRDGHDVSQENG